jgi:hypothetical protein
MPVSYTHLKLNEDVDALAGHYTPRKELRLRQGNRDVLYVVSDTVVDSSCCGIADFSSALVPGFIVSWQSGTSDEGLPVSEVEPVTDKSMKASIRKKIREAENVSQIEFW